MMEWRRLCGLVVLGVGCPVLAGAQGKDRDKGNWRAESQTARSITGDVAFTSTKIAINFSGYWIAQIRTLQPAEASAVFNVDADAAGSGNLYRLSIPGDKKFLHKSTLCGGEDVQWVVTYVEGHRLELALYSGTKMPEMTPEGVAGATNLCGVFGYVN
jgi:hypothetical protein